MTLFFFDSESFDFYKTLLFSMVTLLFLNSLSFEFSNMQLLGLMMFFFFLNSELSQFFVSFTPSRSVSLMNGPHSSIYSTLALGAKEFLTVAVLMILVSSGI